MAPQLGSDTYRSLGKSDGESERINNSIFSLVNEGISPLQTIKEKKFVSDQSMLNHEHVGKFDGFHHIKGWLKHVITMVNSITIAKCRELMDLSTFNHPKERDCTLLYKLGHLLVKFSSL
jgi:hypothetical protein